MSLRILVAEPDRSFRSDLLGALDGHDVHGASSAAQALAALSTHPYPLLVTNLVLGEVCGLGLWARALELDADALVVVTLDRPEQAEIRRVLGAGAYDWLARQAPADQRTAVLRRAVERVLLRRENLNLLGSLKRNVEAFGVQNRKLEEMATRDGLTGLFNQRYFREALELELSRCRRHGRKLSLIFADVDFFKKYNDTQGHLAGDALLTTLGALITAASRRSTVVTRYGGEEFVLLVPETDREGTLVYAEKLRALVEAHHFTTPDGLPAGRITMSFGVATFPENGQDSATLLKSADDALYRAKNAGRNTVCGAHSIVVGA